jgi:hypothetical protein
MVLMVLGQNLLIKGVLYSCSTIYKIIFSETKKNKIIIIIIISNMAVKPLGDALTNFDGLLY